MLNRRDLFDFIKERELEDPWPNKETCILSEAQSIELNRADPIGFQRAKEIYDIHIIKDNPFKE